MNSHLCYIQLLIWSLVLQLLVTESYGEPNDGSQRHWNILSSALNDQCTQVATELPTKSIRDLSTDWRIIWIAPKSLPLSVLRWINRGGNAVIAWEKDGASRSHDFFFKLGVSVSSMTLWNQPNQLHGVWFTPEMIEEQNRIKPWVALSPVTFEEVDSRILPLFITTAGASFGYYQRVGQGNILMMGDSDALSDLFSGSAINDRFITFIINILLGTQEEHMKTAHKCILLIESYLPRDSIIDQMMDLLSGMNLPDGLVGRLLDRASAYVKTRKVQYIIFVLLCLWGGIKCIRLIFPDVSSSDKV